jgi:hypothetical protein
VPSSKKSASKAVAAGSPASSDVRALHAHCQKSAQQWTISAAETLRTLLARDLTFRGRIFQAFSAQRTGPATRDAELAARYRALLKIMSDLDDTHQRLRVFAQWAWAELGIEPEKSLGSKAVSSLVSGQLKRVSQVPFNDLRYAGMVQAWLPYSKHLFADAKTHRPRVRDLQRELLKLGYEPSAAELITSRSWQSPIEFTCQWLPTCGGIEMVKERQEPDQARTLRNAYSKIFGRGAPHLLICVFCDKPAIGEFYAADFHSASHCAAHSPDHLPPSTSEAWTDSAGNRWWRSGENVVRAPCSSGPE